MPSTIYDHLLACAAKYRQRSANPVTAWDQLTAESWAFRCEVLASEVSGLSQQAALAHLLQRRDTNRQDARFDKSTSSWGFIATLDLFTEMDVIIDPVSREHRGWIEVSAYGGLDDGKMSTRPGYRRMLGTNHCVSYCGREIGESEEAWQARRVQWLGRYHPNIHVMSRDNGYGWGLDGGQCSSLLGTVEEFSKVTHSWVRRDTCVACGLPTAERRTQPNVASYSTECGPMCGVCHRERAPHRHPAPESVGVPA